MKPHIHASVWYQIMQRASVGNVLRAAGVSRASRNGAKAAMVPRIAAGGVIRNAWQRWKAGSQGLEKALRQTRGVFNRRDLSVAMADAIATQGWVRFAKERRNLSIDKTFKLSRSVDFLASIWASHDGCRNIITFALKRGNITNFIMEIKREACDTRPTETYRSIDLGPGYSDALTRNYFRLFYRAFVKIFGAELVRVPAWVLTDFE